MEDKWSDWILRRRFGGDEQAAARGMSMLRGVRDAVLDGAVLVDGDIVLDIGAGDGLIAFGALERIGPAARVIFLDVSQPLLDHAKASAEELGVADRCRFVRASADNLEGIDDDSVNVVTTRSVLIYVADKAAAFQEMYRVLRPGGRISTWEPINRFEADAPSGLLNVGGAAEGELGRRLWDYYRALQPLDTDPMLNFDERDLFRMCDGAGFRTIKLTLTLTSFPAPPMSWDVAVNSAANPNVPSLREVMETLFTEEERQGFVAAVRPVVEAGGQTYRTAAAHLIAAK